MTIAAQLVKIAAYAIAVIAVATATVMLLVPYSATAKDLATGSILFYVRTTRFPKDARERFRTCSVSDAWRLAKGDPDRFALAKRNRILETAGGLSLVDTPYGRFWIPERDLPTLAEMFEEQQRDVYGAGGRGVRPGDVVLDCGANVGVFTRHALANGAKLVVAIDPAPKAVECLRRNFRAEIAGGRVMVYPKGVWNKDDTLELTTNAALASTANSVALNRGDHGPIVPLTTVDAIVRELKLDRVDFIKMDIEGAEAQALEGAGNTVARFRPRMAVSLEHRVTDPDTIPGVVHRLWPQAITEYGPCASAAGRIQPDVLFVH